MANNNYYKTTKYRSLNICGYVVHLTYSFPFFIEVEILKKELEDQEKKFYNIFAKENLLPEDIEKADKLLRDLEVKFGYDIPEFFKMRGILSRKKILGK